MGNRSELFQGTTGSQHPNLSQSCKTKNVEVEWRSQAFEILRECPPQLHLWREIHNRLEISINCVTEWAKNDHRPSTVQPTALPPTFACRSHDTSDVTSWRKTNLNVDPKHCSWLLVIKKDGQTNPTQSCAKCLLWLNYQRFILLMQTCEQLNSVVGSLDIFKIKTDFQVSSISNDLLPLCVGLSQDAVSHIVLSTRQKLFLPDEFGKSIRKDVILA